MPKGTFGGSICMCEKCIEKRKPIPEKSGIEIMMDAQVEKKDDTKNDY